MQWEAFWRVTSTIPSYLWIITYDIKDMTAMVYLQMFSPANIDTLQYWACFKFCIEQGNSDKKYTTISLWQKCFSKQYHN